MSSDPVPLIDVGAFGRVDDERDAEAYVRWMDHQRRAAPDHTVDLLAPGSDTRVLDLGCGTGVDLVALCERTSRATGLDRSTTMARAARRRTAGSGASIVVGDGVALPFDDDRFDGCSARAVLVHTAEPGRVVHEIARVVRPGGRVVLSEPDHGTHVVATDHQDTFGAILAHRRTTFANPRVGRRLADLAIDAGLDVTAVWATPIVHRSYEAVLAAGGPFGRAVDAAVEAGAISREDAERYDASLRELDERGGFVFAAMAMTVAAAVP
ncbi:MAG: methyltransferase domain-containing protein [Actinomycetota bacterium]|nr:methyltransferase domain-containing protein [Actinomycetota bacterium]